MPRWELTAERKERRLNIPVTLPLSLIAVIDDIADSERLAVAEVMRRIIKKGLEVERKEREARHLQEQRVGSETV